MSTNFLTKVFIIEDDEVFGRVLQKALEQEDRYDVKVFTSGQSFFDSIYENPDIVTIDYNLPDMNGIDILKRIKSYNSHIHTVVLSGQTTAEVVVEAYKSGANSYIIKNDNAVVELKNSIKNLSEAVSLRKEVEALREKVSDRSKYENIIGESAPIMKVLRLIQKVENTGLLVLITGQSGTGKELVASAIHFNSQRRRKPFVAVNVAAIPEDLIESELFGHEKGAFTGASGKRIGKFEEADGGTIFLDEIGEMDVNLQTKLLRVLQENKISRLGSNKEISLDLRVIAATNKNLGERVKEGKFREDLYYRLQQFLIHLPPLKDRGNDVIILAKYFLEEFCRQNARSGMSFTPEAVKALMEHRWPGNVRELKACVERAALISDTDKITEDDLIFSEGI